MRKEFDEILLSSKFLKQRAYWLNKLSPEIEKTELSFRPGKGRDIKQEIAPGRYELLHIFPG